MKNLKKNIPKRGKETSEEVAKFYMMIVDRMATRKNFRLYTWLPEMKAAALTDCLKYGHNFSDSVSENPFSYFSTIVWNAFVRVIQKEKKNLYNKFKFLLDSPQFPKLIEAIDNDDNIDKRDAEVCYFLLNELEEIQEDAPFEVDIDYIRTYVKRYEDRLAKAA